jgi:hypothetical protein
MFRKYKNVPDDLPGRSALCERAALPRNGLSSGAEDSETPKTFSKAAILQTQEKNFGWRNGT